MLGELIIESNSPLLFQVTEDNKKEYVKLYVNYRWCRGIEQQFLSLQKGFNEIIVSAWQIIVDACLVSKVFFVCSLNIS